jgi:hypothetical protein
MLHVGVDQLMHSLGIKRALTAQAR